MRALKLKTSRLLPDMKLKRGLTIGICIGLLLIIVTFVYLWSLGVFSGSASIGPRNTTVEAAVTKELNARLRAAFDSDSGFSLVEVKSFAAIYEARYPSADYPEGSEVPAEILDKAIYEEHNNITIELTFQGERLAFNEYKVLVYKIMQVINDKLDWIPLQMQVFYQRYPEEGENENVPEYESKIPNYLFEQDQGTVVNSSGTHYMIELDESTEKKAKAYYTTKNIYLMVLSVTVIGLSALFIVRQIKKHRRYNKK